MTTGLNEMTTVASAYIRVAVLLETALVNNLYTECAIVLHTAIMCDDNS